MRNMMILAGVAMAGLLAGCGDSGGSSSAASGGEAKAKREAGNWTNEVEIIKFEMPGMPPEMQESMKTMMASAGATNYCLTPEQAEKDDLETLMADGPGNGGDCTWSKKEFNGKNIDVAGTCTQGEQTADLAMAGTMEAKQSDVTITTKAKAPNGQQMEMVMRVKSKHTGACTADTATAAS